LRHVGLEPTTR